jgi:hypothetical protein
MKKMGHDYFDSMTAAEFTRNIKGHEQDLEIPAFLDRRQKPSAPEAVPSEDKPRRKRASPAKK